MAELLLELLSEEIPARMQDRAAEDLKRLVCDQLKKAGLAFDSAEAYATPRRLALVVDGLPAAQPDTTVERKGPKTDAPDKAIKGFLKSVGLTRDRIGERETPKGKVLFAVIEEKGRPTGDVLPPLVTQAINNLRWPKSMRWANTVFTWVRPLHGIVAIFDGKPLQQELGLGVRSGSQLEGEIARRSVIDFAANTVGHRFMPQGPIMDVASFADYRDRLRAAYVMLDAAERRSVIEQDAALAAETEGLTVKPDPALIAEVAGLVEWPVVLMGAIDPEYMDLPPEVLTTAMRHHLKHFALLDKDGGLAPRFLVVANMHAVDGGKQIVAGNERVLRARLADAKFFWDRDRKRTLESRVPDLNGVVFHAKLGSLGERVKRIEALAIEIATSIPGADETVVREVARLCKTDLVTGMVGEFPELQGVMGRYYAGAEGKSASAAAAIAEHYSPQGPNDDCPSAPASVAVALADKIDGLVGFWSIGEKPTGSKDPFALRRAALGVIRLIVENRLRVSLYEILYKANKLYPPEIRASDTMSSSNIDIGEISIGLLVFFIDRLKAHLREKGVRHDLISAVVGTHRLDVGLEDNLVRLLDKVDAVKDFLAGEDGINLLTAYKRTANILRIEGEKHRVAYKGADVDDGLLREDGERALAARLTEVSGLAEAALRHEDFAAAMRALARLRNPVDWFFDQVTVNCDDADLRRNRLRLLSTIRNTMDRVADFSKIEG